MYFCFCMIHLKHRASFNAFDYFTSWNRLVFHSFSSLCSEMTIQCSNISFLCLPCHKNWDFNKTKVNVTMLCICFCFITNIYNLKVWHSQPFTWQHIYMYPKTKHLNKTTCKLFFVMCVFKTTSMRQPCGFQGPHVRHYVGWFWKFCSEGAKYTVCRKTGYGTRQGRYP